MQKKGFLTSATREMVNLDPRCFFYLSDYLPVVPVVVVFTKCDALSAVARGALKPEEKQLPREEQLAKIKEGVMEMLRNNTAWGKLKTRKYPPKVYVHLESK